jgi:amino acid transporter
MANNSNTSSSSHDKRLHREMGLIGLLFAAIGSIIGSGWLFGALYAAEKSGPASTIAWLLGGILMAFIALSYAELGTMFPVSGGVVRYPHYAFGSFTSYTFGWITWIATASTTAIEVMAALQYANSYLPWLEKLDVNGVAVLTGPGFGVAVGLLGVFSLINVIGIRWFKQLNNTLVWWKLGIITLVIVIFLVTVFHGSHFSGATAGGFFPFGWEGVLSSIATAGVAFSYLGFRSAVELAGEARNPQKVVPIAVVGSIVITAIIYVALQVAFIGALPLNALANGWANIGTSFIGEFNDVAATFGPLAAIAGFMGLTWLAVLLYIDAFISPADTGLIYTTVTSRISYAMGRNKNAPHSLAKVNDRGVPWVSVILTFIAGSIFFLPFPGWQKIVKFVTSATVLSFGSGPLAMMALRSQIPDRERPFRLPWFNILGFLGFLAANLIVYWSGWPTIWKLMIAILIGYVIFVIYEIRTDDSPDLEFYGGAWVIVWLAGLTIISWLGSYPALSKHEGNLGLIGVGWEFLVLGGFSLLIAWWAMQTSLPTDKVQKHINERIPGMDEPLEDSDEDEII